MSFRAIDVDIMLRGTVLAIVDLVFPAGPPSLKEYARESSVAPSTFRRAAKWLLESLRKLLERRRPGPEQEEATEARKREEALSKLRDLRVWIRENRAETAKNSCYSGEAKQRIAALAEEVEGEGVLSFGEIAETLGLDVRQLYRIREQVKEAGGEAPEPESRRPKGTQDLAPQIQRLIADIKASADSRHPYSAAAVRRILEASYTRELLEYHGSETISQDTVGKYMGREQEPEESKAEHPRGAYNYPEPFEQVAVDTSHFKLFGWTFYFVTVFEFSGRLNLTTRVFTRENVEAVVETLEGYLERFRGIGAAVIDRGTPYLNEEVKELLERHGRVRIVCPPDTPTAKAAAERHFLTLKRAVRPAVEKVFPENPGWSRQKLAKLLEMGIAVFSELYHQIPQEGIDGKSPAERIESFDPVRAAASLLELFERAKDAEPSEDYAREIHQRFQLPGSEKETVKKLRQFATPTLRKVAEEVAQYMGPPHPDWLYDPLGFLAAKAAKRSREERQAFVAERLQEEVAKRRREEERASAEEVERQERERREHPERFVERTLTAVVRCFDSGFRVALQVLEEHLRELLSALRAKLGSAFSSELRRLERRIDALTPKPRVRRETVALLAGIAREVTSAGAARTTEAHDTQEKTRLRS